MKDFRFYLAVLVSVIFLAVSGLYASAADTVIFAEPVSITPNSSAFVNVQIQNNPGIMGLHLVVRYDNSVFSSPKVTKGTVTEKGLLDSNASVAEEGFFDVIWTSTEDTMLDGTIVTLVFNTNAVKVTESSIEFDYVQEDTFNEQWEDVILSCQPAVVHFDAVQQPTTQYIRQVRDATATDILIAVESAMSSDDESSSLVEKVNAALYQMTGQTKTFDSEEEIQEKYEEAAIDQFVERVNTSFTAAEVNQIVSNALETVGATSVDGLTEEQYQPFIEAVEHAFQERMPDLPVVPGKTSPKLTVETIGRLEKMNENSEAINDSSNNLIWIVLVIVLAVGGICAFASILIYKSKKTKSGGEKENA